MKLSSIAGTTAAIVVTLSLTTGHAAVFGSLGNFDTVNDTGKPAYGFEIDIEDPSFDHSKITSVFGYDRVFSFYSPDPGAVVRFGKPTITEVPGYGVRVIYGGTIGGIATPANNPLNPFNTSGESCWPGANIGWTANPCDHFGISTYGNPAAVKYSWLVDDGAAPGANAFWVHLTQTTVGDNVDLGDLLIGHNGAFENQGVGQIDGLKAKAEVESEWYELQVGRVNEVSKELKPNGDPSVVIDLKFYKYQGQFDDEGLVDPLALQKPLVDGNGVAYVMLDDGRHNLVYVGQQIGGFNANELAAPIPEPAVYALMLVGLGFVGVAVRRRNRRLGGRPCALSGP